MEKKHRSDHASEKSSKGGDDLRSRRAFASFRRRGDLVWFIFTVLLAGVALGVIIAGLTREPNVIERVKLVKDPSRKTVRRARPRKRRAVAVAAKPAPKKPPELEPKAEPERRQQLAGEKPQVHHKITHFFLDNGAEGEATLERVDNERQIILNYDFSAGGRWLDVGEDVDKDFHAVRFFEFELKGVGANHTLEFKVESNDGVTYGVVWNAVTGTPQWKKFSVTRDQMQYMWGGVDGQPIDWYNMKMVHFAVSNYPDKGDSGTGGRIEIRRIHFL